MAYVRGISDEELLSDIKKRRDALEVGQNVVNEGARRIQEAVLPYHGRYLNGSKSDTEDDGHLRKDKRTNSTAYQALKVTTAGFLESLCPSSRPFILLDVADDSLMNDREIYAWLTKQRNKILLAMDKSGFYEAMASNMLEGFGFGTCPLYIWQDMKTIARCEVDTFGEYRMEKDEYGEICSIYREKWYSAVNINKLFNPENKKPEDVFPRCICNSLARKQPYDKFLVVHAIEPAKFFRPGAPGAEGAGYESVYFLENGETKDGKPLARKFFKTKPFEVNRFEVIGNETYGNTVIKEILGEIEYLQDQAIELAAAVETINKPTLAAPADLRGLGEKLGANKIIYYSQGSNADAIKPIQESFVNIEMLDKIIIRIEERIKEALLNNALKAITDITKESTKFEIAKVYEEKMMILGGFTKRFNSKFLRSVVERYWSILDDLGLIDEPPASLPPGMELKVEFTSLLAQAQRSIGASTLEQSLQFLLQAAQVDQGVLDIADFEAYIRTYNRAIGAPPLLLNSKEQIQQLRAARQKAAEQQAQMENSQKMATAAATMANTKNQEGSLLESAASVLK